MKLDVYLERIDAEERECVRVFKGAVEGRSRQDCLLKACKEFFVGDEGWFQKDCRVFTHGRKVRLRWRISRRRALDEACAAAEEDIRKDEEERVGISKDWLSYVRWWQDGPSEVLKTGSATSDGLRVKEVELSGEKEARKKRRAR